MLELAPETKKLKFLHSENYIAALHNIPVIFIPFCVTLLSIICFFSAVVKDPCVFQRIFPVLKII